MSASDMFVVVLILHFVALAFTTGDDRRFLAIMCTVVSVGLAILHELEKLTA